MHISDRRRNSPILKQHLPSLHQR